MIMMMLIMVKREVWYLPSLFANFICSLRRNRAPDFITDFLLKKTAVVM